MSYIRSDYERRINAQHVCGAQCTGKPSRPASEPHQVGHDVGTWDEKDPTCVLCDAGEVHEH
jgi:hypothetical protein